MSDYLTEGWPLACSHSVYMDGTQLYAVRRWGKPGIITSVRLLPGDADAIRAVIAERVREAAERAWEEGLAADRNTSGEPANPYREKP